MKKTLEELNKILEDSRSKIVIGGKYVHYKSSESIYEVIELIIIEANQEVGVIYKPDYGEFTEIKFLRPLNEFLEEVEVDNKKVQRFEYLK